MTIQDQIDELKELLIKVGRMVEHIEFALEDEKKGQQRFTVSPEDYSIIDNQTGIRWCVGIDDDTTFESACGIVTEIGKVRKGIWRLPTKEELSTIFQPGAGTRNLDPIFNTTGWFVWTCDTVGEEQVHVYNLYHGEYYRRDKDGKEMGCRCFAVRD